MMSPESSLVQSLVSQPKGTVRISEAKGAHKYNPNCSIHQAPTIYNIPPRTASRVAAVVATERRSKAELSSVCSDLSSPLI